MAITTLDDFKRYCLRALGAPVISIDITDEQMNDRWEEALQKFTDFHFDGTEKVYIKHQVTSTDVTNGYIPIAPEISGVVRVLPYNTTSSSISNPFSVEYQLKTSDIWNLTSNSGGLSYYVNMRQYTSLLDQLLNGQPMFRYNKYLDRLSIDVNWGTNLKEGDWVIVEAFRAVTPAGGTVKVYDSPWLKKYTIALFKKQWGANLSKFDGVQMIGGITLRGEEIYGEAMQEMADLEQELRDAFEEPVMFFVG
jgi:hypothetical protein